MKRELYCRLFYQILKWEVEHLTENIIDGVGLEKKKKLYLEQGYEV